MPEGKHESVWLEAGLVRTAPLAGDERCDVCVVGAGIAGLLTADRLAAEGLSVVMLDAGDVAGGETAYTTAHFVTALDDRYTALEAMHGKDGARLAAESHAAAIDHVEALAARLKVDCGWRRLNGYLTVDERHAAKRDKLLNEEYEAATRAGVRVERVASVPGPWPREMGAALRFHGQAQVQPLTLLGALARDLRARGVRVYTQTRATDVKGGDEAEVRTGEDGKGPVVRCKHVVVATNTPFNNLVAVHTKQSGYQTYVVGMKVPAGAPPLPPLLLWDGLWEDDVWYHYLRLLRGGGAGEDMLIVGGEDHKTGQGPDGGEFARLEAWTRARFPMCGAVERTWSGEVMEPADGLAYIGHNAVGQKNVYIVTGDSGNGMTHGAIAGLLLPDLIMGREHRWAKLYDPARKIGAHALGDYAKENLNTFAQYRDWLRGGDVKSEEEIMPGEGAVIVHGLKHLAVYKDEHGACTRMSAACPHLGGVVRWNGVEKTWDCPCHASRFDKNGRVMHGPANRDLKREEKA